VVQRGLLGVAIEDMSYKRAQLLGLPTTKGIYLSNVMARGAAAEAGLRTGDVIMGVNGVKVNTRSQLQEQLARLRPGNEVVIEYFREGKTDKATATLKNENNTTETVNASDASILRSLGFELRNLTQQEARRLGISGVKVTRVEKDSKVARTRMEDGFIITKINDRRATDVDTVIKSLQSLRESVVILEGFYENYEGEFIYKFPMN
jgi:S1-C subfamily serine protease